MGRRSCLCAGRLQQKCEWEQDTRLIFVRFMATSSKQILSLSQARAKLGELCKEAWLKGTERIIAKNGKRYAALISVVQLTHYHQLEREHIHLTLLQEALCGLGDLQRRRTLSFSQLKARHHRKIRRQAVD